MSDDLQRLDRTPLVLNDRGMSWISAYLSSLVEKRAPLWWHVGVVITGGLVLVLLGCLTYLTGTGVGVWGNNHPAGWGWDITNFVFWIGIGHAGTLISAVLFLTRQHWRTSIHRAAEAMTLFAVMCAAIYPIFHLGRAWMSWFLVPVPNANGIWQNFRSPLLWDTFAIGTYFTVSLIFCYTGLIPDLATLRDRASTRARRMFYGILALGWRGSQRQWRHYEMAYLLLAGLSTPLVLSVHSVVSLDFAATILPGWHMTIFPPYFVAGAIFGGFAMVLTILIPVRWAWPGLKDLITPSHLDRMGKVLLFTGCIIAYSYAMEFFSAWYSDNPYEKAAYWERVTGPYWWAFASMLLCNVLVPQLLWLPFIRRHMFWAWVIVFFPNVGMWFERFVIVTTPLTHDFLPSSWAMYFPTWVDICTFAGSLGLFVFLFLLFIRFFPVVSMFEVKSVLSKGGGKS